MSWSKPGALSLLKIKLAQTRSSDSLKNKRDYFKLRIGQLVRDRKREKNIKITEFKPPLPLTKKQNLLPL